MNANPVPTFVDCSRKQFDGAGFKQISLRSFRRRELLDEVLRHTGPGTTYGVIDHLARRYEAKRDATEQDWQKWMEEVS